MDDGGLISEFFVYQVCMRREPPNFHRQEVCADPREEKRRLMGEIEAQKQVLGNGWKMQLLSSTELKFNQYKRECKKMQESNERNMKRLMKHRARFEELFKHRNEPEHFLFMCGFMNEYMQEFMLCHDVHIMNMQEEANPDNMTYEQLLELGESIGKVSKGISKEQFESLQRTNKVKSDQSCPICCTEFSMGERAVVLHCRHAYHEECIMEWLKDENTCPICKQNVLG